jgi:molybdate transport system ATP-binding protein
MMLCIDVRHRLGSFLLDARFETGSGLVALFGRSGAGKTSIIISMAALVVSEVLARRIGRSLDLA